MCPAKTKARPGRPVLQQAANARDAIVTAACLHFSHHGIKGSSNRLIAAEAGVTAAMIHYYFPKRPDLYQAVLAAGFSALLEQMAAIDSLETWSRTFHTHLRTTPWLPHLMIREVLNPSGQLRSRFLKHFAPKIFGHLRVLVGDTAKTNKLPKSFDVDRHVVLLMGLLVYPFLSLDLAQALTGKTFDTRMLEGFRDDAMHMFMHALACR